MNNRIRSANSRSAAENQLLYQKKLQALIDGEYGRETREEVMGQIQGLLDLRLDFKHPYIGGVLDILELRFPELLWEWHDFKERELPEVCAHVLLTSNFVWYVPSAGAEGFVSAKLMRAIGNATRLFWFTKNYPYEVMLAFTAVGTAVHSRGTRHEDVVPPRSQK